MSALPISNQILEVVTQLSPSRQTEVLDFALFVREREQTQKSDAISNEEAARLKTEFGQEDIALAEAGLVDYLAREKILEEHARRVAAGAFINAQSLANRYAKQELDLSEEELEAGIREFANEWEQELDEFYT